MTNTIEFPICHQCKGLLWVCETHGEPWNQDCCNAPGEPCECNKGEIVKDLRGFIRIMEIK